MTERAGDDDPRRPGGEPLPAIPDAARAKRYWTPRGRLLTGVTRSLIVSYRVTGGLVGARMRGLPGILLTTTGRRSGEPRVVHLPVIPSGDDLLVVASFAGGARNPAWYFNLTADPTVTVQLRRDVFTARAERLDGPELVEAWRLVAEHGPWYVIYQEGTDRPIPIVRLRRA